MSKDPRPVQAVVAEMIEAGGWRERLALGRLRNRWTEVVGAEIGAHCEPVRLVAGVLSIRAESGVWASELTMLSRRLKVAADEWLGGGLVGEVKVVAWR